MLLLLLLPLINMVMFLTPAAHPGSRSKRRGEGAPSAGEQARRCRGVVKGIIATASTASTSARGGFVGPSAAAASSVVLGQEGRVIVIVVGRRRLGAPRPRRRAEAKAKVVVVIVEATCSLVFVFSVSERVLKSGQVPF